MGMKLSQITSYEFIMANKDDILDSVESGKLRILNKTIKIIGEKFLTPSTTTQLDANEKQKVYTLLGKLKNARKTYFENHKILNFFINTLKKINKIFFGRDTVWVKTISTLESIKKKIKPDVDLTQNTIKQPIDFKGENQGDLIKKI